MTKKQLCKEIKKYDFDKNTIINFAKTFNISISTVQRYRKECGLPPKFKIGVKREIDNRGRFCLHAVPYKEIVNIDKKHKISGIPKPSKVDKKYKDLTIQEKEDLVDELFTF